MDTVNQQWIMWVSETMKTWKPSLEDLQDLMSNKSRADGCFKMCFFFLYHFKKTQKHELSEISSILSNMFEIAGQLMAPFMRLINKKANT